MAGEVLKNVLIIGGGLAGCTAARELSSAGIHCCIVEQSRDIGGKVRGYGCKSDSKCNNCGLCAVGSLWQDIREDSRVRMLCSASVVDISQADGEFCVLIQTENGKIEERFTEIIVAAGFQDSDQTAGAGYDGSNFPRVCTGNALELLMKERSIDSLFPEQPDSIAFIMCYGSRTRKERAAYCSQVCCAYSTRAAKVMKQYYPGTEVVFFYMDLQAVNPGNYAEELAARGIRFDRCRPGEISFEGKYPVVAYEDAEGKKQKRFDYLFLNTGIHPDITGNTALADLTGLKVERSGFLGYVSEPLKSGVYLAGCSLFPMGILDTIASARNTAAMLINKEARGSNWEHEGGVQ